MMHKFDVCLVLAGGGVMCHMEFKCAIGDEDAVAKRLARTLWADVLYVTDLGIVEN